MPPADLHEFIALLVQHNLLTRISVPTDPLLEIAAITNRVCKYPDGGSALLFEHPLGSIFPVATNLFGSLERTSRALGVTHLNQLTARLSEQLQQISAPDFSSLDRQIADLPGFSSRKPTIGNSPAWDIGMPTPDITAFPFLQGWPDDGSATGHSRYITLPQVFTSSPDGSTPNCGMYRCQIHSPRELAIRWNPGSGAARHLEQSRLEGKPLPVAIALGGPPAALFSAILPLPGTLDEMTFAGFLQGAPISMADCRTVPLQVPAKAEVVIEGYVDPRATVQEGPFGNHTGRYAPSGPAALMRITSLSHRRDAIIPATVVGQPPMEDSWMAKGWERLLLAILKTLLPGVVDIHFPLEWIFHQSAIISLEKPAPGMVRETAERLWSMPWFATARQLIFVSADDIPLDSSSAAWMAINMSNCARDLFHDSNGTRWALDATGHSITDRRLLPDPGISLIIDRRWPEYGIPSQ